MEFDINTLTQSQCQAIIEAFKFCFPDMIEDCKVPFVETKPFVLKAGDRNCYLGLFIFGNLIYIDPTTSKFKIRRVANGVDSLGNFYMEDDSEHDTIQEVIKRIVQRQLDFRIQTYYDYEIDDDGKEIPYSSRYECAIHGRKHKEYIEED